MELSLKDYFFIIIKKWKILAAFVLAGILLMFCYSYFLVSDKYEISTTADLDRIIEGSDSGISVSNKEDDAFKKLVYRFKTHIMQADYLFDDIWNQDLKELYSSYGSIKSKKQADIAFDRNFETIGQWAESLGYSKKSLKKEINFSFSTESQGFFTISIIVKDPQFGVSLLAAYNYVSMQEVKTMSEPASTDIVVKADYVILDHPAIPDDKDVIRPNILLNMFLGALVGLILAVSVILIINYYDVKIKGEDDIKEKFDVPVIASIPDATELKKR